MSFPQTKQRNDGSNRADQYGAAEDGVAEETTGRGSVGLGEEIPAVYTVDQRELDDDGDIAAHAKSKGGHLHSFANLQAVPEHDETYGEESPMHQCHSASGQ